ncbi:ABC transporter ATP-binding protein [Miniphocaeibacter halophilus]|uniref:ABC transporter ATP-binding protein n=1 Tax=Miniphocaeibacter halophilus TaxID=2931922 RepID=A0AC61MPL8_9FIRM|nr:ABC transporter ATP-binding protein [Miniphocaeibacter halophilus]QQK07093.1 ABC transporter ATP-binding protein [Miniphocaeibacter halophilus]
MLRLLKFLKPREWFFFLINVVFISTQVFLDLKIPDYMTQITQILQTNGSLGEIINIGIRMVICALGSLGAAIICGFFAAKIAAVFGKRLRGTVFNRVQEFSKEEIKQFSTDSLITRSTNDITQIQMIIAIGAQMMIKAPIMAVWAILKIYGKNWQWSLTTGIAVLIMMVVIAIIGIFALPRFRRVQKLIDSINRVIRENLTGIRVVKAYNAEEYQENKFEKANEDLTKNNLFTGRLMGMLNPMMRILMNGIGLAIYWMGAYLIYNAGYMEKINLFSDMVVFTSYATQVVVSFMMLTMIFIMMPRAQVSANRINEVLDTKPSILDGDVTEVKDNIGEVEFKNVCFKYPDAEEYVLKNINFKVKPGETLAIIGSTGSGKSTIVDLIPRFYDATEGEVLVNGINVRDYKLNILDNYIGYVSQKTILVSGTIRSNIDYGDNGKGNITDEAIQNALEIAQAADFVNKLEDGVDSYVAQGGTNFSGGQKQRISIARAIARDPAIYIFDDSFSALDLKTDKMLRQALDRETSHATNIIVSQRIGSIKNADKILVMEDGEMAGLGTHEELIKDCKVYQEIAYSQLSQEELA